MVFVRTDLEAALRRTVTRVADGGHAVDEKFQRNAWREAMQNLETYQQMFGSQIAIIDNSIDLHDKRDQSIMGTRLLRKGVQLLGMPKRVSNLIGQEKLKDVAGWYTKQRASSRMAAPPPARPTFATTGTTGVSKMAPGMGTLPGKTEDGVPGMGYSGV